MSWGVMRGASGADGRRSLSLLRGVLVMADFSRHMVQTDQDMVIGASVHCACGHNQTKVCIPLPCGRL